MQSVELKINNMDRPCNFLLNFEDNKIKELFFRGFESKPIVDSCHCNYAELKTYRWFIKYIPEQFEKFSLKIQACPNCGNPMRYKLITYPLGVKNYLTRKTLRGKSKKQAIRLIKSQPKPDETEWRVISSPIDGVNSSLIKV